MAKIEALKRRIAPSVILGLDLKDDDGARFVRSLHLSFDFNAFALIYERTGVDMISQNVWAALNPVTLSIMLWAAVLACQPEYASEEGLGVIRSYMDVGNQDLIAEKLFDAYFMCLPEAKRNLLMDAKERALRGGDPTQAEAAIVPAPPEVR